MKRAVVGAVLGGIAASAGCGVDKPFLPDGRASIVIMVADTSGILPGSIKGVPFFLDSAEVRIQSRNHLFTAAAVTSPDGIADFTRLDSGTYSVFARREVQLENNKKVFTGSFDITVTGTETKADTVMVRLISASQLMINEIKYCGSCASTFYFYDIFVELYNASADTMYLDGMIVTRNRQAIDPLIDTYDYVSATYAYQFPGTPLTGRQHPILPGQFVVIATDAVDHRPFCPTAEDLSHADWEMFNPLANDFDNVAVPNLVNIMPNKTVDFLIGLTKNAIVLTDGSEYEMDADGYLRLPVRTVVDGVEYSSNASLTKELTKRVDAGFAGIGITRYSGYSTERRELGLDTNDSTFDFMNLMHATPGYFHSR